MDNFTQSIYGENDHAEIPFSVSSLEELVQLNFQFVRCDKNMLNKLKKQYSDLLTKALTEKDYKVLNLAYRMVGYTRDLIYGKGEYAISYMMIDVWHNIVNSAASFLLRNFVSFANEEHPYGSWKDIKGFIGYLLKVNNDDIYIKYHFLINNIIVLINTQLKYDLYYINIDPSKVSLCAKWVPRETNCSLKMFYEKLAVHYYKNEQFSVKKSKMYYRKNVLSKLNKFLDTVQIKMCGKSWATIDHNKTPSIALKRNKTALLNLKKNKEQRSDDDDRIICAENFKKYIESVIKDDKKEMKGKRVGVNEYVAEALKTSSMTQHEIDVLNLQWKNFMKTITPSLNGCIVMADVSGSMNGDPLNACIGLSAVIQEISTFGRRVLTFSETPTWVNLDNVTDFISVVSKIRKAHWGTTTNFYKAFQLIIDVIKQKPHPPIADVENLMLVILSDMQINQADKNYSSMYDGISSQFKELGLNIYGKELSPPLLVFWNLRSTNGMPCATTEKGVIMMSGFSPVILNSFCEKGIDVLKNYTPENMFIEQLKNKRYDCLGEYINLVLC
jgi:hypothetical protein